MKTIIFTLLIGFTLANLLYAEWIIVDSLDLNYHISGFSCADSLNCMSIGELTLGPGKKWAFLVRRTTDGGATWKNVWDDTFVPDSVKPHIPQPLYEIEYQSTDLCLVIGKGGRILRSTDRGDTWQEYSILDTVYKKYEPHQFVMSDSKNGVLRYGSFKDSYMKTEDGGLNWKKMYFPDNVSTDSAGKFIRLFQMLSKDKYSIVHGYNKFDSIEQKNKSHLLLTKTDDGGLTFTTLKCPDLTFGDLFFLNDSIGWLCGTIKKDAYDTTARQRIYKTTDGGISWFNQMDNNYPELGGFRMNGIKFINENIGIAINIEMFVFFSTDGGNSWRNEEIPNNGFRQIAYLEMLSPTCIYVGATNLHIYKYITGTDIKDEIRSNNKSTVYPNPAQPGQSIKVALNYYNRATHIRLFNSLGISVAEFVAEVDGLTSEIRLTLPEWLSAGVYWLTIEPEGKSIQTVPVVVY